MLTARKSVLVLTLWAAIVPSIWAQNGPNQPPLPDATSASAPNPNRPMAVNTATYEIGAQDLIYVEVWKHEEFTKGHRVRPDGKLMAYVRRP